MSESRYDPRSLDPRSSGKRKSRLFASQVQLQPAAPSQFNQNGFSSTNPQSFPLTPRPPSCPPLKPAAPPPPRFPIIPNFRLPPPPAPSGFLNNVARPPFPHTQQPIVRSMQEMPPFSPAVANFASQPALIVGPVGVSQNSSLGYRPSERESENFGSSCAEPRSLDQPHAKRLCTGSVNTNSELNRRSRVDSPTKIRADHPDRYPRSTSSSGRHQSNSSERSRSASTSDCKSNSKSSSSRSTKDDHRTTTSVRTNPSNHHATGRPTAYIPDRPNTIAQTKITPYRFLESSEFYKDEGSYVTVTEKLKQMHELFRTRILKEFDRANKKRIAEEGGESSSDETENEVNDKKNQPKKKPEKDKVGKSKSSRYLLHEDLPYNAKNRLNDGKACCCSKVLRGYGTKHGHFVGEEKQKFVCDPLTNNADKLFCYQVHLEPTVNFSTSEPTIVRHGGCDCSFQGLCLFSHVKLNNYPDAVTSRLNVVYRVSLTEIPVPKSFVLDDLLLISKYIFVDILELKDWKAKAACFEHQDNICDPVHVLPVFGRSVGDVIDVAPMSAVLDHFIKHFQPMFNEIDTEWLRVAPDCSFQEHVNPIRGTIALNPGRKPAAIRVDQIDKDDDKSGNGWPVLVHFTTKSSKNTDAGVDIAVKKLEKMRAIMESKNKEQVSPEDKMKLREQQNIVDSMMRNSRVKKEISVVKKSRGFFSSGIRSDIAQWGLLVPWISFHYRYHMSLDLLEEQLEYKFNDRNLLTLALTHPSCKSITGTNPDHIRNSQSNLGIRKRVYGQAEVLPKSGMKTLIYTMAQLGADDEMASPIRNYERLEFLGDAVLEFLTSLRLFLIFPSIQEGGLATFRSTLVQNNQLAVLAEVYHLSHYLLILHGREESSRKRITDRHATANCFEAICGAIYMDGGIRFVDDLLCRALNARLFVDDDHLKAVWKYPPCHIGRAEYPFGDRHLIPTHELLQRMEKFEETVGIQFNHIRLLANAFSSRSIHENPITLGNNQRLEFLGDTVLQLLVSDYVFKHFPKHHEGHLSLLRSSLVSNKTQAFVCDELGMTKFYIRQQDAAKSESVFDLKLKDKADLIEAFLGALYLDQGLTVCHRFCKVTFYPKLTDFIANQAWSDPKSRLQQSCLTMKRNDGAAPNVPFYKVINKVGPSNNRSYDVAVYLNDERLATGSASNTKLAEEAAAEAALNHPMFCQDVSRQRDFAKRAVAAQNRHRQKR